MYLYAVEKLNIKTITHKFIIRGHTQNEGDAAHSVIKKCIKQAKKSGPIYVPDQYVTLIRNAKKRGNPFIVQELGYNEFLDLKSLSEEMTLNTSKDTAGNLIKLSEIKMVRFTKGCDTYSYRTNYIEEWTDVKIRIRRSENKKSIDGIQVKPAYKSKISIPEKKKEDLLHLLKTNIIPKYYEPFFNGIF